jgi:hypothetical protein
VALDSHVHLSLHILPLRYSDGVFDICSHRWNRTRDRGDVVARADWHSSQPNDWVDHVRGLSRVRRAVVDERAKPPPPRADGVLQLQICRVGRPITLCTARLLFCPSKLLASLVPMCTVCSRNCPSHLFPSSMCFSLLAYIVTSNTSVYFGVLAWNSVATAIYLVQTIRNTSSDELDRRPETKQRALWVAPPLDHVFPPLWDVMFSFHNSSWS